MTKPTVIAPYDPIWPLLFEKERDTLIAALGDSALAIEHIGSTAVPGLAAKPIIDIMIGVADIEKVESCIVAMTRLRFEHFYWPEYPERHFFRDGPMGSGPHHVHMTELGGAFWKEKLLFRDHLRRHPDDARRYAALKRRLAKQYGRDREDYAPYTAAKGPFIEAALGRAGKWP